MELHTTLCVIPPHEVHQFVQPLLNRTMPEFVSGYNAHITILHPFAPYNELSSAAAKLKQICESVRPFTVRLSHYDTFPLVAYIAVDNPKPLQDLQRLVREAFPDYLPYDGQFGNDYKPHITIAHLEDESGQLPEGLPLVPPLEFTVKRLHVQYGVVQSNLPWITYDVIHLRD